MAISNFPTQLQPAIQQGYLAKEFMNGLESRLGFRAIADRETFPNQIGETITKTRKGLKTPVTTPLNPASNTNFDNGLTPSTWGIEQYTLTINQYGDTIDLNMVTQGVGIQSQFLANAYTNGVQAIQSLDRLARNALFSGATSGVGGYLGGNTWVNTTLGAAGTAVQVDNIRGFQTVLVNGVVAAVSVGTPMTVTVGANVYSLTSVVADGVNVSKAPGGISGTLNFATAVAVADATVPTPGNAAGGVIASTAPLVIRPNGRNSTKALVAPQGVYGSSGYVPGDTMTMDTVLRAVAALRDNNVPTIDGHYNLYLDNQQMIGLFRDQDFKYLYRGAFGSDTYRSGEVFELLGARFIPTTEAPQQISLGSGNIHRGIMLGQGALVEGDFANMAHTDLGSADNDGEREIMDAIAMVTREPLDRLKQIIAQSWYWIGGFALPTDYTANPTIIPTASNAYLKRGVVIESV